MKVFVTGGSGFIGKHLVAKLLKDEHEVLLLSRNKNGKGFIKGDLSHIEKLENKIKNFKPDIAIHLAWEGIPNFNAENCAKNLVYGINLLRVLARIHCKSVLITGSCVEYGKDIGKLSENQAPVPRSIFSITKNSLRLVGEQIAKENNMQFIWTRLFYVYGPGQREGSLIPHALKCFIENKPVDIKNPDGANDFIYLDDVVEAMVLILKNCKSPIGVYNIGSGRLTAVEKVIKVIYGGKVIKNKKNGFYADISKIKKEIGWKPRTNIEDGIKQFIKYHNRI